MKRIGSVSLFALMFMSPIFFAVAQDQPPDQELFELSSKKCSVSKDSLVLEGDVLLTTPFGEIRAERAKAQGTKGAVREDGVLELEGGVVARSTDGSREVKCESATFSCKSGQGSCRGENKPVFFRQGASLSEELTMTCRLLTFSLDQGEGSKADSGLNLIRGEGGVVIRNGEGVEAKGEMIETTPDEGDGRGRTIHLHSLDKPCQITIAESLFLEASRIVYSENDGVLRLYEPKGDARLPGIQMSLISDFLTWYPDKKKLILEGKTKVTSGGMVWVVEGKLTAELNASTLGAPLKVKKGIESIKPDIIPLKLAFGNLGKGRLQMTAQGKMVLTGIERGMTVDCTGTAVYNAETGRLVIEKEGAGNKVHLLDKYGEIFSDRTVVVFGKGDLTSRVEKIELFGGVGIVNRMYGSGAGEAAQFLLADEAIIEPLTDSVHLKAKRGKRVLIMDRVNRLQLSAESLQVKRGTDKQPFSIKGGGDVRFSFKEEELSELKKRFKLERSISDKD